MAKDLNEFNDMPLTRVIQEYLNEQEWEDDIEANEDRTSSSMATLFEVNGQACRLFVDAHEVREQVSVFLYSPFNAAPARMQEMARMLNYVNNRITIGRLTCHDNAEANPIRFKAAIDTEGGSITAQQIRTMVSFAISCFNDYLEVLSATALTKMKAVEIWAQFLEDEQVSDDDDDDDGQNEGLTEI